MYCQKCRTPLNLDSSLGSLNPAAFELLVSKSDLALVPWPVLTKLRDRLDGQNGLRTRSYALGKQTPQPSRTTRELREKCKSIYYTLLPALSSRPAGPGRGPASRPGTATRR